MSSPTTIALPPLSIGNLPLGFAVGQAALSGYSDWPMRVVARRLGAGYTLCEVMLDQFVINVTRGRKARHYIHVSDDDRPCGAQLMGSQPTEFAAAATKMVAAGFDWIDINFGCPVKKVVGKCRGGYLLSDPEAALAIVARVREAVPPGMPVTVKMRRGLDDTAQSRDHFFAILDGAFSLGIDAVAVHGRTVAQRYEGPSNWRFLREVKQHLGSRTLLGSGDLFSAADCLRMMTETGCDGVLAARGAIGNPWIFRDVRELAAGRPTPPPPRILEQRDLLVEHFRLAESLYGPKLCTGVMSTMGIKYARLHPHFKQVRAAFVSARNPAAWNAVLDTWYAEDGPGCDATAELA